MHNPYSEDQLIEQPAIELRTEIGWETRNYYNAFYHRDRSPLGRQTKTDNSPEAGSLDSDYRHLDSRIHNTCKQIHGEPSVSQIKSL